MCLEMWKDSDQTVDFFIVLLWDFQKFQNRNTQNDDVDVLWPFLERTTEQLYFWGLLSDMWLDFLPPHICQIAGWASSKHLLTCWPRCKSHERRAKALPYLRTKCGLPTKPPFLLLLRAQSPMPVQCAECPNWPNWSHSILPLAGDCKISISDWMDGGRNEITGGSPKIEHELLPAFAKGCPHTPRNFESFSERFFFCQSWVWFQCLPLGWRYGGCWHNLQYHGDNRDSMMTMARTRLTMNAFHAVSNCNLTV